MAHGVCGANKKNGEGVCKRPAGWGTNHVGVGRCKLHGGKTQAGTRSAAAPALELLVGHTVDVDPMEALLMCVRISAAEVAYFSHQVSLIKDETELITRPTHQVAAGKDPIKMWLKADRQLNLWVRERHKAMERLARYSKMAIDAGVEERLVRVAETVGSRLADAIQGILNELELDAKQLKKAPQVVRKHLTVLEGAG